MSLAPAVTRDGFSFASGDLYAEASGHNRHRRATVAELKDHFNRPGSEKDHPAHWFEAQLIHYGLQPSKTKSVARMRLFDAVNAGKLEVPGRIKALETDLKKEWLKSEREAKKAAKASAGSGSGSTTTTTVAGKKRKADASNVDLTVNVGGINITVSANSASSTSASAAKKTKTSATSTAGTKAAKDSPKPKAKATPAPKSTTTTTTSKKATTASFAAAPPSSAASSSAATPVKKQTARRGGISQGPPRGSASASTFTPSETAPSPRAVSRSIPRARRSKPFFPMGRISAPSPDALDYHYDNEDDDDLPPPPPYREYNDYSDDDHSNNNFSSSPPPPSSSPLEPLGLLNGSYEITSNEVRSQWPSSHSGLSLVFTLSGRELWGKFDLGVVSGILHLNTRPWESSHERKTFTWRGEETEGPMFYGGSNRGWIRFLGGGRIEGELDFMRLDFKGERFAGQGTRSEVDARRMQGEWNGYTEQEYERSNRARWG